MSKQALRELTSEQLRSRVQRLRISVMAPKSASTVVAIRGLHDEIETCGRRYSCNVLKLMNVSPVTQQ